MQCGTLPHGASYRQCVPVSTAVATASSVAPHCSGRQQQVEVHTQTASIDSAADDTVHDNPVLRSMKPLRQSACEAGDQLPVWLFVSSCLLVRHSRSLGGKTLSSLPIRPLTLLSNPALSSRTLSMIVLAAKQVSLHVRAAEQQTECTD